MKVKLLEDQTPKAVSAAAPRVTFGPGDTEHPLCGRVKTDEPQAEVLVSAG